MKPSRFVEWMSSELGLTYEDQDWGIVNADAGRVAEYIGWFWSQLNRVPDDRRDLFCYAMIELVFESMRLQLGKPGTPAVVRQLFLEFWAQVHTHHGAEMELNGLREVVASGSAEPSDTALLRLIESSAKR